MKSIKKKIETKGVTKKMVAKMVGINSATLSRIIAGKQDYVSPDIIKRINKYLDALNTDDKNILN